MTQVPAIDIRGVHKHFDALHVLQGVDLRIMPGEGVVLLGANGCGKSTLMRCINRLERHETGTITVNGTDVGAADKRGLREIRREVGCVFQQFNLVPNLTVFQNVLFGAMGQPGVGYLRSLNAFATEALRDRAVEALRRVNLLDRIHHRASQLSGGQQQRVAIARMLMQNPKVVMADEPIASLDPRAGREILDLLWEIVRERGMTVLCTLHQLDFALEYGDRIVGLKKGRVVLDGPGRLFTENDLRVLYEDRAPGVAAAPRQKEPA